MCRPPRGGRGLKSYSIQVFFELGKSPPSRGAWIEIAEIKDKINPLESPPSRGAWIEIGTKKRRNEHGIVAPLAGGVD